MEKKYIYLLVIFAILLVTGCSNEKNKFDLLKGDWKASPENQKVYKIGSDGETSGGKEDYILKCDGNGYYDLKTKTEDLANAHYTITDNIVTFYDEGRQILGICKINNNELDCSEKSYYAFKYTKVED